MVKGQLISGSSKTTRVIPNWSEDARRQMRPFTTRAHVNILNMTNKRAAQLEKRLTQKEIQ